MFGQPLGDPTGRPPAALVPILSIRTPVEGCIRQHRANGTAFRVACQKKAILRQPSSRTTSLLSIRMPAGSLASQSAGCSNVTVCIQAADASVTSPSQLARSQKRYLSSQPWEEASSWAFWMTFPEPVRQLRALKAPMRAYDSAEQSMCSGDEPSLKRRLPCLPW